MRRPTKRKVELDDEEPDSEVITEFLRQTRTMRKAEFARLMGWSPQTEASRRARGQVPKYTRVGQSIFYAFDDVNRWLSSPRNSLTKGAEVAISDLVA